MKWFNYKNIFFGIILWVFPNFYYAQTTHHSLISIGYQNINGNYLTLGPNFYFVTDKDNIYSIAGKINLAYMNENFIVIPEVETSYIFNGKNGAPYSESFSSAFYKAGVSITPYSIAPKVGISVLSLLDFFAAYSFSFQNHPNTSLQGVVFGFNINLPLQIFEK